MDDPKFPPFGLAGLSKPIGVGEHGGTAEATVERRPISRLLLALDEDAVVPAVTADRALKAWILAAPFFADSHGSSVSNDRSTGQTGSGLPTDVCRAV